MPASNGDTYGAMAFRASRFELIPHTEIARLSPTTDAKRFHRFDAIKASEDCGTMPTSGFRPTSNNVKPPVNGKKAAKAGLGVTGGYVNGAHTDRSEIDRSWAPAPKTKKISQNARKRAAKRARTIAA